jgi:hypothetical protein
VPSPGKPTREAPHLHINNVYHSRLKQWLVPFKGVATKNLPNYLGWRRAIEAWGDKLEPSKALSATGHINRQRYKSPTLRCENQKSVLMISQSLSQPAAWFRPQPGAAFETDNKRGKFFYLNRL